MLYAGGCASDIHLEVQDVSLSFVVRRGSHNEGICCSGAYDDLEHDKAFFLEVVGDGGRLQQVCWCSCHVQQARGLIDTFSIDKSVQINTSGVGCWHRVCFAIEGWLVTVNLR